MPDKDVSFKTMTHRLEKIREFMDDPFKAPECVYSLVIDVINGEFDQDQGTAQLDWCTDEDGKPIIQEVGL